MILLDFILGNSESRKNEKHERLCLEAENRFNIVREDDIDYVTFDGIIVSRSDDKDTLDRLNELRYRYVELRM